MTSSEKEKGMQKVKNFSKKRTKGGVTKIYGEAPPPGANASTVAGCLAKGSGKAGSKPSIVIMKERRGRGGGKEVSEKCAPKNYAVKKKREKKKAEKVKPPEAKEGCPTEKNQSTRREVGNAIGGEGSVSRDGPKI